MSRFASLVGIILASAAPACAWARYPEGLPTEMEVQKALADAPGLQAARAELERSRAEGRALRAGPHEWTLSATEQRRTDPSGLAYSEQAYELSKGVRWFGKASLDRALGDKAVVLGDFSYADAWHEAGRGLLSAWFDWVRAVKSRELLLVQSELVRSQLARVNARVRAGDAAAIDLDLAQTELDRSIAAVDAASVRVNETALLLNSRFPSITLVAPQEPGEPTMPPGSDEEWTRSILNDNHEIELAEAKFDAAQLQAERAGRDRIPDPTIGVRYSDNFDGNRQVLGLNVSIPLGGAARRATSDSMHALARAQGQRARETRARVEADAQRVVFEARANINQWLRLRDIAGRAVQNAERFRRGYDVGEFTITDVLLAQRQAVEAQAGATLMRLDALESLARLELDAHHMWRPPGE